MNLAAIDAMVAKFPTLDFIFVESGGNNPSATFSPELVDLTIYVVDVAAGEKIPRKGGPGITRSDLLVINKVDLAPLVGASLDVVEQFIVRSGILEAAWTADGMMESLATRRAHDGLRSFALKRARLLGHSLTDRLAMVERGAEGVFADGGHVFSF